ncbi:MAG: efflux RND transporter permease subunit, partial [Rikenellaceae bacterium]
MIKRLIERPIAVTMCVIAFIVLGFISLSYLPVSLMPDVDIPKVSVHVSSPGMSVESLSLSAHPVKAKSTNTMKRKSYDSAFKQRAIKLSENLG